MQENEALSFRNQQVCVCVCVCVCMCMHAVQVLCVSMSVYAMCCVCACCGKNLCVYWVGECERGPGWVCCT